MDYKVSIVIVSSHLASMRNTYCLIILFAFIFQNGQAQEKPHKGVKSIDSLVQVINGKNYSKFYPKECNKPARSYDDSTAFYIDTLSHNLRKVTHKRMHHTAYRDTRVEVFLFNSYLKMSNGYISSFKNTFYKKGTNNSKR